ncbi:MAG: aldo/keto reductase [Bacteroidales bacterium]|nr:aldo/keto reductase [Bacteroidales bacterium]MDD4669685.1 aldo/keto reductase [Bacteroidales bacterium]
MKKLSVISIICAIAAALMVVASCGTDNQSKGNMKFRILGSTGINVSEIGIGCGGFEDMTQEQARKYMDVAIDSSINYIDIYDANPVVRGNIGYALRGRRDKMNIQGHIGAYWNGGQYERTRDVEKCKKGFEELLTLLETDHIEVGMMHIVDDVAEWNQIVGSPYLDYVHQLKAEGKIKHIGVSSHNAAAALAAAKSGEVEVIMFSLNPAFDRVNTGANVWDPNTFEHLLPGIDPVRVELYDYCAQHRIAIVVMKVYGGGGRLLDAERSPLKVALTPDQCLSYALSKPCVAVALSGTQNVEQLVEDLHYLNATDQEKDFNSALSGQTSQNNASGECTYCNHCSPCAAGIEIDKINELLDQAEKYKEVPQELKDKYLALEHHASECTECGACESRCPFDVPIRQRMKEAVRVFGK